MRFRKRKSIRGFGVHTERGADVFVHVLDDGSYGLKFSRPLKKLDVSLENYQRQCTRVKNGRMITQFMISEEAMEALISCYLRASGTIQYVIKRRGKL